MGRESVKCPNNPNVMSSWFDSVRGITLDKNLKGSGLESSLRLTFLFFIRVTVHN